MSKSILQATILAICLGTVTVTGFATTAQAKGQFVFDITASKNSKLGKGLAVVDTVLAGGKGNNTKIGQYGKGNSAGVSQNGNGNLVGVGQFGNNNATTVNQTGNGNIQGVLQVGDGTSSTVNQTGNNQVGLQIDAGF